MMAKWLWLWGLLLVVVFVPFLGHWLRRPVDGRCSLDGMAIEPPYRVRLRDADGRDREFCCIRCAELWLQRQPKKPQAIFVTDEAGGGEIDARTAVFVRSLVVTTPTTGNRIHAFRDRADADRHVQSGRGKILGDGDKPFYFGNQP